MPKQSTDLSGQLVFGCALAAVALIPFIPVAVWQYLRWRKRHLPTGGVTRIVDLGRALQRTGKGAFAMAVLILFGLLLVGGLSQNHPEAASTMFWIVGICGVGIGIQTARAFAAGLLGVIVNHDAESLTFPSDGVLRSYADAFTIIDAVIPGSIETLLLSAIRGWTRQAGKSLLLHGEFGSRAITFSDKLRRDQLLKVLSGYESFSDLELAGPGDYA